MLYDLAVHLLQDQAQYAVGRRVLGTEVQGVIADEASRIHPMGGARPLGIGIAAVGADDLERTCSIETGS